MDFRCSALQTQNATSTFTATYCEAPGSKSVVDVFSTKSRLSFRRAEAELQSELQGLRQTFPFQTDKDEEPFTTSTSRTTCACTHTEEFQQKHFELSNDSYALCEIHLHLFSQEHTTVHKRRTSQRKTCAQFCRKDKNLQTTKTFFILCRKWKHVDFFLRHKAQVSHAEVAHGQKTHEKNPSSFFFRCAPRSAAGSIAQHPR